jgi:AcrR family transcriptional regulator
MSIKTAGRAVRRKTQNERTEATKALLMAAARGQFAEKGFSETSIDEILSIAGVTRGALYHHFASKSELFKAVFEEEEKALVARVMALVYPQRGAWAKLQTGCRVFLEACLDPTIQRIVLRDARAVLALDELREIESRYTLALLRNGLTESIAEGAIVARPVDTLASMLLGALSESAMAIARSSQPKKTLKEALRELDNFLNSITKS